MFLLCDVMHYICRATVVCRQLAFDFGEAIVRNGAETHFNIVLDNVKCTGNESSISQCPRNNWGEHECTHSEDVGLRCCKYTCNSEIIRTEMCAFIDNISSLKQIRWNYQFNHYD